MEGEIVCACACTCMCMFSCVAGSGHKFTLSFLLSVPLQVTFPNMPTFLINICPLLIPPGKKNYIGKKKEIVVKVKLYLCELCWNGNR